MSNAVFDFDLSMFLIFSPVLPTVSSVSCCKSSDALPVFDANKSREMSAEFSGSADLSLEGNQLSGPEFPVFNFSCISIATNNFSEENKLGQGGFGPVYKVKMLLLSPSFSNKKSLAKM